MNNEITYTLKDFRNALNRQTVLTAKIQNALQFDTLTVSQISNAINYKEFNYTFDEIRNVLDELVKLNFIATYFEHDNDYFFNNITSAAKVAPTKFEDDDKHAKAYTVNRIRSEINKAIDKNAFPLPEQARIQNEHIYQFIFALALSDDFRTCFNLTLDVAEQNFFTNHDMWNDL